MKKVLLLLQLLAHSFYAVDEYRGGNKLFQNGFQIPFDCNQRDTLTLQYIVNVS